MVLLGVSMIGFAYPAWFETLKRLPASRASVFVYLTPVFAETARLLKPRGTFAFMTLDRASALLTEPVMTRLTTQVERDRREPADVVRALPAETTTPSP